MSTNVVMRGKWDRLRYSLLLEITLIAIITPAMAYVLNRSITEAGTISIVLCIKALAISVIYNDIYDRIDAHHSRVSSERSLKGRVIHALGFECVLTLTSLPIIIWMLGLSVLEALVMDLTLVGWVVLHTFCFTLAYDRLFPVIQPKPAVK